MAQPLAQFEQDQIHELVDSNFTTREIADRMSLSVSAVNRCAASYGAYLRFEAPSPYEPGTDVPGDLRDLEIKPLKPKRVIGGTNGEQVF